MGKELIIDTPSWGVPFLEPSRYKGLKGGRSSGKSHFFGEGVVEKAIVDPYMDIVCLREVQKSLKFSAKKLIEQKIRDFGAQSMFKVLESEIRRIGKNGFSTGIMIFNGMADHTADSIKSLEGFNLAWFEEAQRMSQRSLNMLRPTIREPGSEMWFSWNPDQETDPIEKFLGISPPENAIVRHINFTDNTLCPDVIKEEAALWLRDDPDSYDHVWMGGYNTKSDDQILGGKWCVEGFEIQSHWDGPYYGADWGFSTDPSVIIEFYIDSEANIIYITREVWGLHVETDHLPAFFDKMSGAVNYVIRGDNSRPENISYLQRHGYRRVIAAQKWDGSIMDGISKLRSFKIIVVHPGCQKTADECRLYKYKRDRLTDDVLPDIIDKHNHCIDAIRYGLEPMTKRKAMSIWDNL